MFSNGNEKEGEKRMFLKPICQRCQKNPASVKLTRIVGGKVIELHLCKECATEVSPLQKKISEAQKNLAEVLEKLLGGEKEKAEGEEKKVIQGEKIEAVCSRCGMSYEKYKESYFLGCPQCYVDFEKYLLPDIRKVHGETRHIGKVPPRHRERFRRLQEIDRLNRELERAIEREEFELAAKLRDQIKFLKSQAGIE